MTLTPSQVGERAEAAVAAALVHAGKLVYLPFGSSGRIDLVFSDEQGHHTVQCKAATVVDDVVIFRTSSNTGKVARHYRGEVDYFGVYCHARDEVFLVPVDDVPRTRGYLRVAPTRNGQSRGVRWAADYLLEPTTGPRQRDGQPGPPRP